MEKRWTWLILIMIALVAFAGCSDDDDPVTPPPSKTAFQTMAEAGAAYINESTLCPGVISAADLNNDLASYTVIDIRQPQHYAEGHIPGAYNSSLGSLLDDLTSKAIPSDKPYVIACYSGQSAGHAKIAMELFDDSYEVYSLLFGMCSWSLSTTTSWDNNTGNLLSNPETTDENGGLVVNEFPTLAGDASTIVATRVASMLANGFKGISFGSIEANLDDYFIINYFGSADYLGTGTSGVPGHIPGAYQFTPYSSLAIDQMLDNLPDDGTPIVVYCWTGQHSSQITAYLNMLGYEAYSLSFGSNSLFYDNLTAHKWSDGAKNDFALEMGSAPTPAFSTMAAAGAAYVNDNTDCPGVLNAQDLYDNLEDFTVIDIRAQADYEAGHIVGAYHSSLGSLVADLATIPTDKPYVLACYSGQSAGHAKIAMEMLGYGEVYSLLFGMSSWSSRTEMQAPWNANTGNTLTNPSVMPENDNLTGQVYPVLAGDPGTIVDERVNTMLTNGFKGVAYDSIKDNLGDYFVINYFSEADYLGTGTSGVPGHIPGAFQFTPYASMDIDQMLNYIPADMPVVVYCWTGQHSSQITAYLNMLGYDAYSLKFGSNNLFYDNLTAHKWSAAATHDFPLHNDTVAAK